MFSKAIKVSLVTLTMLAAPQMQAGVSLRQGDINLSSATASLSAVHDQGNGSSLLVLTFQLNGCLDHLGPVFYHVAEQDNNAATVYVAGVNIVNEASFRTDCLAAPTASYVININGSYTENQIRLVPLTSEIAFPTQPNPPITCMAFWTGYEYNPISKQCEFRQGSGCSNPFTYKNRAECAAAHLK